MSATWPGAEPEVMHPPQVVHLALALAVGDLDAQVGQRMLLAIMKPDPETLQ